MYNWIKRVFSTTNLIGDRLLSFSKSVVSKILLGVILASFSSCCVVVCVQGGSSTELRKFMFVLIVMLFLNIIIIQAEKYLLSLSGFLGIGLGYYFLIVLFICMIIRTENMILNIILSYIIGAVLWWIYSLIANNKVASVANEILSTLFALIVLLKDTIITIIPSSILEQEYKTNYTVEKILEMIFDLAFSPILAINFIAVIFCILKGYWIEKYNNNMDISSDILDDITEMDEN